jgi:hypothetical protein
LGIGSSASFMLSKCSTTGLHPLPKMIFLYEMCHIIFTENLQDRNGDAHLPDAEIEG